MWKLPAVDRTSIDVLALQAHVECAGSAMACAYSSSDEFEAAVISAKRDAGVYGPKRRRRLVLYAGVAATALAAVFLMI